MFLWLIFFALILNSADAADTVRLKLSVRNPSADLPQTAKLKSFLPKEIVAKNVLDAGGLDVDYDDNQGLYFVYSNNVELQPTQTKVFEIVLEDVWVIPDEAMDSIRKKVERVIKLLKDSPFLKKAQEISNSINEKLSAIKASQEESVTRQQHIAQYRENIKIMEGIKEQITQLEKILVTVGGPPNIELLENSNIDLKSPTTKTTWVIIFAVLIFISIMGATFYFTWQRQSKITENIFTREKDVSFADFKKTDTAKDELKKAP